MISSSDDAIERLPGDLKEVAGMIGLENTLLLVTRFGGTPLLIPKCDGLIREIRNKQIRELYDTGKYTARDLAWRFKLTDRTIKTILSGIDDDIPPPLLQLMEKSS